MAKNRNKQSDSATPPESAEVEVQPPPAEPVADGKQIQREALENVGIVLPDTPRVYCVEIPRSLIGERHVKATSEAEALAKYKAVCGITTHGEPARVKVTELKAEDVDLFGEP